MSQNIFKTKLIDQIIVILSAVEGSILNLESKIQNLKSIIYNLKSLLVIGILTTIYQLPATNIASNWKTTEYKT